MKTIAIFSAYYYPHLGGIERYIHNLMSQFLKKGHRVILITSNYNDDLEYEEKDGLIIYRLPVFNIFKNRYPIFKYNKKYHDIMKKLDNYDIDRIIVNTRFHLTSHIGARYGKKHSIPVYLIEHGSNYVTLDNKFVDFFANRYEDFLTWKIKNKITGFYGVSQACCDWLKKIKISSSGVWYNSIDIDQKVPDRLKHDKINFTYAGRLIKQKGVENILVSFSNLEREYNNIELYIAGDGPELLEYKNKFKSDNIHFLGKLNFDDLFNLYAKTDIFLYPPLWPEGLPTSILEAGLMQCSVIGTSVGGSKEVLNSENSIIVEENQKSLEKAMKKMIDDEKFRVMSAKNMNEFVMNNFSWEVTAQKVLKDMGIENE